MKASDKNRRVYVGFRDLEKDYDRVKTEAQWQVLRMYDVDCNILNKIKNL